MRLLCLICFGMAGRAHSVPLPRRHAPSAVGQVQDWQPGRQAELPGPAISGQELLCLVRGNSCCNACSCCGPHLRDAAQIRSMSHHEVKADIAARLTELQELRNSHLSWHLGGHARLQRESDMSWESNSKSQVTSNIVRLDTETCVYLAVQVSLLYDACRPHSLKSTLCLFTPTKSNYAQHPRQGSDTIACAHGLLVATPL